MLFVLAAGFWILALIAAARLAAAAGMQATDPRLRLLWLAVFLAGAVLLFRPHEDVFGGEDPGSYLNAGVTFGRRGSLTYQDPLLARVPPGTRSQFYYGHAGYGLTKDACLWIIRPDRAVVGPRFHPAYPLLIAGVSRLAGPAAALYVVPLFALGMALALAVLAGRLIPHPLAGFAAAAAFLLNPLTLWHGRCARPELVAGFLAWAGLACLALAAQERDRRAWADACLAGLCLGAAPLFHVTAWYVTLPATLAVLLAVAAGRLAFGACLPTAFGMFLLCYAQTVRVTDAYRLRSLMEWGFRFWPALAAGVLLAALLGLTARRRRLRAGGAPPPRLAFAIPLAGASLAFFAHSWLTRDAAGSLPWLGRPVDHFAYLTHWQAVIHMLSAPIVALALAGWALWLTGPAAGRVSRVILALVLCPALILAGEIRDFMMTRYLMLALVPATALCLAALATGCCPVRTGRPATRWRAPALALAIALAGLAGRVHLVTLVEHRGLLRFLASFARDIKRDNGLLLGEYSRLTAPLEHLFGIPALGLDNQRHDQYRPAEEAWTALMAGQTGRPAFFTTPFQTPRSDRFTFELLRRDTFPERHLQQAYDALPTRIASWPLAFALYRMRPKAEPAVALPPGAGPAGLPIGPGNMGFRHWGPPRAERPNPDGRSLAAGETVRIPLPFETAAGPGDILLLATVPEGAPEPPALLCHGAGPLPTVSAPITGGWWCLRARLADAAGAPLTVSAGAPLTLGAAFLRRAGACRRLDLDGPARPAPMPELSARWTRAASELLLPAPRGGTLFVLAYGPPAVPGAPARTLTLGDGMAPGSRVELHANAWQWLALTAPDSARDTWVPLRSDPPWDPRTSGFPDDLGVLAAVLWLDSP